MTQTLSVKDQGASQPLAGVGKRRFWVECGCLFLFLALSTVFLWWGLFPHPGARTFGGGCLEYVWSSWWLQKALCDRPLDPLFCPEVYWPVGASVAFHDFSFVNTLPAAALLPSETHLAWHNLCLLVSFTLTGFFTYRLAYAVTGCRSAALVAGFLFAFCPFRVSRLTQLNTLTQQFIPLFFLGLWRASHHHESRGWKSVCGCGLWLSLSALGSWYHLSILLVAMFAWGIWNWRWEMWLFLLKTAIAASLLLSPWLVQIFWHTARFEYYPHSLIRSHHYSSDLLYYFLPHQHDSGFYRKAVPWVESVCGPGRITSPERVGYFLGFSTLLLAGIAVFSSRIRRLRVWIVLAGFALVLSLGPCLQFGGRETLNVSKALDFLHAPQSWVEGTEGWFPRIPLPYLLFRKIPLIGGAAVPRRFAEIVMIALVILAAEGFKVLLLRRRLKGKGVLSRWGPALAAALVIIEFLQTPVLGNRPEVSPFYTSFLPGRPPGAVLEVPMDYNNERREYGYYQTFHERPLLSAIIGRVPRDAHAFVKENRLTRAIHTDLPGLVRGPVEEYLESFTEIREAGVRHVVLHGPEIEDTYDDAVRWFSRLPVEKVYEGDGLTAFEVLPE